MTKQNPTPEAFKRVIVTEDPAQEALHEIRTDPTSGGDLAYLTVNPDLLGEGDTLDGLKIKAAVEAALEPFRRYNRTIQRRYGIVSTEQAQFDKAEAQAREEFEQLIHLAPRPLDAPAPAKRGRAPTHKAGGESGAGEAGAEPAGAGQGG